MKGLNPHFQKAQGPKQPNSVEDWLDAIQNQGISGLSRALSLLENKKAQARQMAINVLQACMPYVGKSKRIAITGIPGAGKSTFIEALGTYYAEKNHRIAILAVDPSSQRTGGSILGDKTRMEKLAKHPNVYIRPSATDGTLGGVAAHTREAIYFCEAAGYDMILIETVGVGQSEVAVHSMADAFILLTIPGAGDELQGIKRGIMEMADCIIVNKAEPPNSERAKQAASELKNALHVFPPHEYGIEVEVFQTSAHTGLGINEVAEHFLKIIEQANRHGMFEKRRIKQSTFWLNEALNQMVIQELMENKSASETWQQLKISTQKGEINPFTAAHEFWEGFLKQRMGEK
jgi:LAO/AO transport system kinase